ncbi:LacI family DNA-binding transcriptional regulator [Halomonas sp.]|uniref:LacI family DNA-binding transcriptional regulator n=1 Tax=Halomonas sp. TaxID=1486246 RepID=UPI00257EA2C7|nr:LacI family DNA-binding transcriptional regulator [Halomonas sp.]MCJ8286350.1 LacI family DNA-binding transcriptional regulator [Halomonas sp.]NQY72609.1 LacI family DNA-binding transcriptional regulator [Halomonas sp.]
MSKRKDKITLEDVAREAGVSLGTASKALSCPEKVKPRTLERVLQAVADMGYVRNGVARSLAARKTWRVAVVYPTLKNPMFSNSIDALQQTLLEKGYQLVIGSHEYSQKREVKVLQALVESGVDGVILVGTDHDAAVFALLEAHEIPYLLMWSLDETNHPYTIGFSNHQAAYEMALHVIAKGHRKVALCGGPTQGNERSRNRQLGFLVALEEANIAVRPDWIIETPFSLDGGREAIRRLFALDHQPTVLICGTDLHAIGAMHQCQLSGIDVPGTLSITGFDDIEFASAMTPGLTTVRVPIDEIGVEVARTIVAIIDDQVPTTALELETMIVERESLRTLTKE